jgi:hypothetical protein
MIRSKEDCWRQLRRRSRESTRKNGNLARIISERSSSVPVAPHTVLVGLTSPRLATSVARLLQGVFRPESTFACIPTSHA